MRAPATFRDARSPYFTANWQGMLGILCRFSAAGVPNARRFSGKLDPAYTPQPVRTEPAVGSPTRSSSLPFDLLQVLGERAGPRVQPSIGSAPPRRRMASNASAWPASRSGPSFGTRRRRRRGDQGGGLRGVRAKARTKAMWSSARRVRLYSNRRAIVPLSGYNTVTGSMLRFREGCVDLKATFTVGE